MRKEWSKISLFFLFLVALIGTLLRSMAYIPIPAEYANLVHAHSHVAFQGWIYTIMFLLLTNHFLKENEIQKGRYALQFKITIVVIVGILISFSLQGYGLYSIIFSTLFQILNYWFIFRFLKDVKVKKTEGLSSFSLNFIKTGLYLGLLSTLLPFGIGILSAKGLGKTEMYQSLVYTFLHLQYNGWFLFLALGLLYKYLEIQNVSFSHKFAKIFYWLFTIAIVPASGLSLLGMEFSKYIAPVAYLSAILQGIGLIYFLFSLKGNLMDLLKQKSKWFNLFFIAFLVSFVLKATTQNLSALPVFKTLAFFNKNIIVAYLHLSLIGSISFLLLALLIDLKWLRLTLSSKMGSVFLIGGFVITETILVSGGIGLYYNQTMLIFGSVAMALGILLLLSTSHKKQSIHGRI